MRLSDLRVANRQILSPTAELPASTTTDEGLLPTLQVTIGNAPQRTRLYQSKTMRQSVGARGAAQRFVSQAAFARTVYLLDEWVLWAARSSHLFGCRRTSACLGFSNRSRPR